jgi:hypothetical protein
MEISRHAMLRYVQRVRGIKDGNKASEYLKENKFEVAYRILELLNSATVLYKNYTPTRKEPFDYFINDELLMVVNTKENELTTLYYVTLDIEDEVNSSKVREYVKVVKKNIGIITTLEIKRKKQDKVSVNLEYMIKKLRGRISDDLISEFEVEFAESINICKGYAADSKKLRLENRDMMTQIFKKIN